MKAKKIVSILAVFCILLLGGLCLTACGGGESNKLTISFDSNGGTNVSAIEYVGGELAMPSDPTREDYLFGGWFEDNGTWEEEFDSSKVSDYVEKENITLYAKWLKKVNLVFLGVDEPISDIYLDSLDKKLPVPNKEGYVFVGWYLDNNTFQNLYTTKTIVKENEQNEVYLYPKWKVDDSQEKTIYYIADGFGLEKSNDIIEPQSTITLYQPNVAYHEFVGWFYDDSLTMQAPMRMANSIIEDEFIILYGKFVAKEIDTLTVLGQPKIYYEYGEKFDLGNAKLLVQYKDAKYANEIVEITPEMVRDFSTEDNGQNFYYSTNYPLYDFCDSFYISALSNEHILASTSVKYYVKSDIEKFSILGAEDLTFNFGNSTELSTKNLSVSWEKVNGEKGTEVLRESDFGANYSTDGLYTNFIGSSTFQLRYHFKTILINYTVNPVAVESGYIDQLTNPFLINAQKSLLDKNIKIYLKTSDGKEILYDGLKTEDVVEDIDTSTIGLHKAKIMFDDKEIEIAYTVIDIDKIVSAEIEEPFYTGTLYFGSISFTVTFTLEDESTFKYYFVNNNYTLSPNKKDSYTIQGIDTSSAGIKYARVYFYGKEFDVKYTVIDNGQFNWGNNNTFEGGIVGHL